MKNVKIGSVFATALLLAACVMLSSSEVTVENLTKPNKGPKALTILNNTPYLADMSVALSQQGFTVMPMPTQQQIVELQTADRIAKYNEAATRWGVSLVARGSSMKCAFTDFNIYYFTLMLTDIATNKVVMVLKQKGSDGPCTTVKPVFDTLAQSLSENW